MTDSASWVVAEALARSPRPGYGGERGSPVPREAVDAWLAGLAAMGVRSIICLLAEDQLGFYAELPGGLVGYYRDAGFTVAHVPVRDHQQPPLAPEHLDEIWRAYRSLPRPVLVHCSAGVDRTGRAIEHIRRRLAESAGDQAR